MESKTQQLRKQIDRLRTDVDPKFQPELSKIADELDKMLDGPRKGGAVRAKRLSKKRRKEIAVQAARARWDKSK